MSNTQPNEFNLLILLDVMLQEKNVTNAAKRLGISQPAASSQLSRLRKMFGDPLFVPAASGRGMVPTARALEIEEELHFLLKRLKKLTTHAEKFDPHNSARTFYIATDDNPATVMAPYFTDHILKQSSNIKLAFVKPTPASIIQQMENGDIDLWIALEHSGHPDLIRRPLIDDDFLTAQRISHPRGTGELDIDTYCSLEHVIVSLTAGDFSGLIDKELERVKRKRRVTVSVQSYLLAPVIVANSDCICTLPRHFLMPFAHMLEFFSPPLTVRNTKLSLFWHRRNQHDSGHQWIRNSIIDSIHLKT